MKFYVDILRRFHHICEIKHIQDSVRLKKCVIKILENLEHKASYWKYFTELELLTAVELYIYELLVFVNVQITHY
jgi:hypothetical protein